MRGRVVTKRGPALCNLASRIEPESRARVSYAQPHALWSLFEMQKTRHCGGLPMNVV